MRRVRHSVATSSLALTLAGAQPSDAQAGLPIYIERTGSENPFEGLIDSISFWHPSLHDLDGDGDLDLLMGGYLQGEDLRWWENTGTSSSPVFDDPPNLDGQFTGYETAAALADLDDDGDLDALVTNRYGIAGFGENVGGPTTPDFVIDVESVPTYPFFQMVPIPGVATEFRPSPALGDVDGDGDFDVLIGTKYGDDGDFVYSENVGTPSTFSFVPRTGAQNPFDGFALVDFGDGMRSAPTFVDLDGDGDLDLVVGTYYQGLLHFFENTGTPTSPSYVERTGAQNPLDGLEASIGKQAEPHFADLDGDGDLDLVTNHWCHPIELPCTPGQGLLYFENVAPTGTTLPVSGWAALATGLSLLAAGWRRLRRLGAG